MPRYLCVQWKNKNSYKKREDFIYQISFIFIIKVCIRMDILTIQEFLIPYYKQDGQDKDL